MLPLLLHVCCGPCSIMPIIRLREEGFEPTLWFMNPNIHPLSEYLRRREAAEECAKRLDVKILYDDASWNLKDWLTNQLPRVDSPSRCNWCCGNRIEATFIKAKELGFEFFSTSLLYSRYQPHEFMQKKGEELNKLKYTHFIYRDFRTDWITGIEYARKWEIYRQPYCGCIFSENERYAKKLARLICKNM